MSTAEEIGRDAVEVELGALEREIAQVREDLEAGQRIGQATVDSIRESHGRLLIAGSVWNTNVAKRFDSLVGVGDCRP